MVEQRSPVGRLVAQSLDFLPPRDGAPGLWVRILLPSTRELIISDRAPRALDVDTVDPGIVVGEDVAFMVVGDLVQRTK